MRPSRPSRGAQARAALATAAPESRLRGPPTRASSLSNITRCLFAAGACLRLPPSAPPLVTRTTPRTPGLPRGARAPSTPPPRGDEPWPWQRGGRSGDASAAGRAGGCRCARRPARRLDAAAAAAAARAERDAAVAGARAGVRAGTHGGGARTGGGRRDGRRGGASRGGQRGRLPCRSRWASRPPPPRARLARGPRRGGRGAAEALSRERAAHGELAALRERERRRARRRWRRRARRRRWRRARRRPLPSARRRGTPRRRRWSQR